MSDGQVVIDIKADDKAFRREVADLGKNVQRSLKGVEGAFSKTGSAFTRYVTTPIVAGTTAAVVFGIKTAASFEQTEVALETMLGSAEAAKQMLDDLKTFAAKTPFEIPGLMDATKRLLAYGFAAEDVIPMLTSVGDAAAGLSLGTDGLNRIIVALGQIKMKGAVQAEEMRQLAEAGIPAWDALAHKLGVTIPEAMKLVEQRAVDADDAIAAITERMDRDFGGMMLKQADTLSGLWSNLKDVFSIKLGEAFQENLEPIKDTLRELIDVSGPLIDALMPAFVAAMDALLPVLQDGADLLQKFADADKETQETVIKMVAALALLGPALKITAGGLGAVNSAIGIMTSAKVAASLGNWSAALKLVTANVGTSATALAGLSAQTAAVSAGYVALAGAAGYGVGTLINSIPAVEQTADALAEAAGEADSLGEYLATAGERQKTWVDYVAPGIPAIQTLAAGIANLTTGHKAQQVATDATVAEWQRMGIELDENNNLTDRGIEQLRLLNEARKTETTATADATWALREYDDALNMVRDTQMSAERADIALERAKYRLEDAQAALTAAIEEYGPESREAKEAALDFKDAQLDVEDATRRVEETQLALNDAQSEIPRPNSSNKKAWMDYYQAIGDKAGYAAAKANAANDAIVGGKASGGSGTRQIPVYGSGTFASHPHLAYVGDEPEVIIPLGDKAAADKYLPMVFDSLPGGSTGGPSVAPSSVAGRTTNYYLGDIQVPPGDAQAEQVFAGLIEMAERYGRMVPVEEM